MQTKNEKIVYQGKMIEIVHETVSSNGKEFILEHGRRAPGVRLIIERFGTFRRHERRQKCCSDFEVFK